MHLYIQGCFNWFPDVHIAIILYVDDAISTETLNMSRHWNKEEQMVRIFWAEPKWIIPPTDDKAMRATALKPPNLMWAKFRSCTQVV